MNWWSLTWARTRLRVTFQHRRMPARALRLLPRQRPRPSPKAFFQTELMGGPVLRSARWRRTGAFRFLRHFRGAAQILGIGLAGSLLVFAANVLLGQDARLCRARHCE